jgi:hypothetical protein
LGTTEQLLVLKMGNGREADSFFSSEVVEWLGRHPEGWEFLRVKQVLPGPGFEEMIGRVVVGESDRALGSFVEDSDYAYVIAFAPGHVFIPFLLNPDAARDYKDGRLVLERLAAGNWSGDVEDTSQSLAAWSAECPQQITPAEVRHLLTRQWTYAEEGVARLLDALGLPFPARDELSRLEGARDLILGKSGPTGEMIDWEESRFVVGLGEDFVGVWDRQNPGLPVRRFDAGEIGTAMEEAERLERESRI